MKRGIWGRTLVGVAALCLVAFATAAAAKGRNSIVGEWDLDAAKSTMNGQAGAFKSGHVSTTATKEGYKGVVDVMPAAGAAIHYEFTVVYGESVPVTGNASFDSATVIRIDDNTSIRTERRGGKVVGITTIEVAKDGKSFTSSGKGTSADGKQFTRALSWTRAKPAKKK
jgi:hypothetical protein